MLGLMVPYTSEAMRTKSMPAATQKRRYVASFMFSAFFKDGYYEERIS